MQMKAFVKSLSYRRIPMDQQLRPGANIPDDLPVDINVAYNNYWGQQGDCQSAPQGSKRQTRDDPDDDNYTCPYAPLNSSLNPFATTFSTSLRPTSSGLSLNTTSMGVTSTRSMMSITVTFPPDTSSATPTSTRNDFQTISGTVMSKYYLTLTLSPEPGQTAWSTTTYTFNHPVPNTSKIASSTTAPSSIIAPSTTVPPSTTIEESSTIITESEWAPLAKPTYWDAHGSGCSNNMDDCSQCIAGYFITCREFDDHWDCGVSLLFLKDSPLAAIIYANR
jgi:hypothetical protein